MQLYWRENRLQIEPDNQKERDTLLLLAETGGIRKTFPERLNNANETLPPLEIEIHKAETGQWVGRIPALVGVEYSTGLNEEDARLGVLVQAFRELATRIERCREVPVQIFHWFELQKPAS